MSSMVIAGYFVLFSAGFNDPTGKSPSSSFLPENHWHRTVGTFESRTLPLKNASTVMTGPPDLSSTRSPVLYEACTCLLVVSIELAKIVSFATPRQLEKYISRRWRQGRKEVHTRIASPCCATDPPATSEMSQIADFRRNWEFFLISLATKATQDASLIARRYSSVPGIPPLFNSHR
jgi:hypothetical protein